ncbi:helix-turn-helix transcriptional regulator [Vibrio paucivorans]
MNKDNFSHRLKELREQKQLSQEELVEVLSQSHRAFLGVNQVTVSQWERGKTIPSFVRRLGLASFFKVDYDFSVDEMGRVKSASKLMDKVFNQDAVYDYQISHVEHATYADADPQRLALMCALHKKLYGQDIGQIIERMSFSPASVVVLSFMCESVILGHVIYDGATHTLLSVGAVSIVIRRRIFDYLAQHTNDMEFNFPTIDPAMAQFLYDLYLEPVGTQHGLTCFRSSIKKVVENPFSQTIQTRNDVYFKYIRYHDLKMKKKSIEFILGET